MGTLIAGAIANCFYYFFSYALGDGLCSTWVASSTITLLGSFYSRLVFYLMILLDVFLKICRTRSLTITLLLLLITFSDLPACFTMSDLIALLNVFSCWSNCSISALCFYPSLILFEDADFVVDGYSHGLTIPSLSYLLISVDIPVGLLPVFRVTWPITGVYSPFELTKKCSEFRCVSTCEVKFWFYCCWLPLAGDPSVINLEEWPTGIRSAPLFFLSILRPVSAFWDAPTGSLSMYLAWDFLLLI